MEIVKTTKLSQQQIDDVQQLLKTVHHADQTYRSPYLSSQYNYLSEMPAFVLLYANHVLSGFSMLCQGQFKNVGFRQLLEAT